MNFLHNKQLKQLGAYVSVLAVIVFIAEFFILQSTGKRLTESELKLQYTREAQLANQEIILDVEHFLNGREELAPVIVSKLDDQDHRLKTLHEGGRIDQREDFLRPLSRLPRITFDALRENWNSCKHSIYLLVSGKSPEAVSGYDSTQIKDDVSLLVSTHAAAARMRYEGTALTMANWYQKLINDLGGELDSRKSLHAATQGGILIFNFLLIIGIYYLFTRHVVSPLQAMEKKVRDQVLTTETGNNEIGKVAVSVNETIENLKDATDFITAIADGNLAVDYKETFDRNYETGKNKLADSLIRMQAKLKELNEVEQKRQWSNEGLAKFVDIIRSSNDDLRALGDSIISALVHYTKSNQGGLYILNDEDKQQPWLELISLFAYDVKKHEQQRIKPGQGILGQTFLEKETTYLTYLPEEYVRITSGLGGANPRSVLIVPLKVDREVYGLVELASFNEFKPHEIAFVEKLGETIASSLASVRAAQKNRILIEQFQFQTEQMRAQEEEMRQNMEELQATQEEVVRKEKNYIERIHVLESQLQNRVDSSEVIMLREELERKQTEHHEQMQRLEQEMASKAAEAEPWMKISEIEKSLRINLEALEITREAEGKKS